MVFGLHTVPLTPGNVLQSSVPPVLWDLSYWLDVAGLPSAETQAALTAALDDFFGKKKSKLHR